MNILLTGSSGFIGKGILNVVSKSHTVFTLGRKNCDFNVDLSKDSPNLLGRFDRVIHNAGMAHILDKNVTNYRERMLACNYQGTVRLLNSLEKLAYLPRDFIFISSVSVYGLSSGENIEEVAPLLAEDAYGKSKILAEQAVIAWGEKYKVKILIFRLPLVVGENPPGNLGNMINAMISYKYFSIGKADARKSMVLLNDFSNLLGSEIPSEGIFNLTDGYNPSFRELENAIKVKFKVKLIMKIPKFFALILSRIGEFGINHKIYKFPFNKAVFEKMTTNLTFSTQKAKDQLNWTPNKALDYFYND